MASHLWVAPSLSFLLILGLVAGPPASAQAPQSGPPAAGAPPAGVVPPPDHPEVAYMFLLHHQGIAKEIQHLVAETPAASGDLERSAAASMNLTVPDFKAVGAVCSQIQTLLDDIDKAANEYRDKALAGNVALDIAVVQQFNARKTSIKATIKQRLRAALSPAGWKEISAYIEGPFRQTVLMVKIGR